METHVLLLLLPSIVMAADLAGVENPERARVNYMLNCQGCHGPSGQGTEDGTVPTMTNFVGHFFKVAGGREFLVRVPGSANAALTDNRLAEVLNWMVQKISREELPDDFTPYTAREVGEYRQFPLQDVIHTREKLIEAIDSLQN